MKDNLIALDFHLFDGEGGGESGAETARQSDSKQDVKNIQYGKESKGEGQTNSHVGSDNGTQNEAEALSAEWKALTSKGGKFHDLYGQGVSDAVQSRFRNQADLQGQVDKISEDLSPLFMNYGLKAGDFEGLKNAIANDQAFFQAGAEREGLDVEQYKQQLKLKADAERYRQITEAYQEQQRQNNGTSVRDAFVATHLNEIMNGSNAQAAQTATQNVVNTIQQRAARPVEGAINQSSAIQRKSDPSRLSNEDIDEINRRVALGEAISF